MKFSVAQFTGKTFEDKISIPEIAFTAKGSARLDLSLLEISPMAQIRFGKSDEVNGFIDFGAGAYSARNLQASADSPVIGSFRYDQTFKDQKTFGGFSWGALIFKLMNCSAVISQFIL